jgi:hypothetical protein
MTRNVNRAIAYCFAALLSSCAFDTIHVRQLSVQIQSSSESKPAFFLAKAMTFPLGTGFTRTLREGTKWEYVGTVQHGDVFKSRDQVFTVEASNIHEAYLVVSEKRLVGFYLPVERTYSPLANPIELTFTTTKTE